MADVQVEILSQLGKLQLQMGEVQGRLKHIAKDQETAASQLSVMAGIRSDLDAIVPLVRKFDETQQRAIGAAWLAKLLWAGGGAALLAGGATLWGRLTGGGPQH